MSRKKGNYTRKTIPDPVYHDLMVSKFINHLMADGKKSIAQNIFYSCIDILKEKVKSDEPLAVFKKAIENSKPSVEVRSRRVGGATYQVPVEIRPVRRQTLAMRWLVGYARERKDKTMSKRLASELMDAYNNRGNAVKKRDDVHRMSEANKAFAHYNW